MIFAEIGTQPVETENVPIEGSLETSYLLDQVTTSFRYFLISLMFPHRLKPSVELFGISEQKIPSSKAKTCSGK